MEQNDVCIYINPDNAAKMQKLFEMKVAVIARPDWFIRENNCQRLIIETALGVHTHCFLGQVNGIHFLIIYGRFNRVRGTSTDINFELTQSVINLLNIKVVVGTFAVGTIKKNASAGSIYLPDNLFGIGGYNQSLKRKTGFRNTDMYMPICKQLHNLLKKNSTDLDFKVITNATYVCFHNFPRIETKAELEFYEQNNWDIVGQTMDPEATLARESGCHYAGIAAAIDDVEIRARMLENDNTVVAEIDKLTLSGREKTFELFLKTLQDMQTINENQCSCKEQGLYAEKPSTLFYYQPCFD